MSNFSHGRTSNSTLDDVFSGVADGASSTGATSDSDEYSDDEGRLPKQRRLNDDGDQEYEIETVIKSEVDDYEGEPKTKKIKTKVHDGPSHEYRIVRPGSMKVPKGLKIRANALPKVSKLSGNAGLMKAPTAPVPSGQQRKYSSSSTLNFQHQLGIDEEDLSSKPRCQRCRKSKKGCDRQRPCQRCKDAGIGIEGCVSEDEGNGRKGRYGRHMGVVVKKSTEPQVGEEDGDSQLAGAILTGMASADASPDKSKKRKR
jgi:Fungal Zn(2)-Cys(6) binuclear cluster domain